MVATAEDERHVRDAVDAEYDMWMETYKKYRDISIQCVGNE